MKKYSLVSRNMRYRSSRASVSYVVLALVFIVLLIATYFVK
jgi:hypothetical protein